MVFFMAFSVPITIAVSSGRAVMNQHLKEGRRQKLVSDYGLEDADSKVSCSCRLFEDVHVTVALSPIPAQIGRRAFQAYGIHSAKKDTESLPALEEGARQRLSILRSGHIVVETLKKDGTDPRICTELARKGGQELLHLDDLLAVQREELQDGLKVLYTLFRARSGYRLGKTTWNQRLWIIVNADADENIRDTLDEMARLRPIEELHTEESHRIKILPGFLLNAVLGK